MACLLAGDGKAAAGQRIVNTLGERALANDGKLCRRRERAADERAEKKSKRRFRRERIDGCTAFAQQQPRSQSAAAEETAEHIRIERSCDGVAARDIDA